MKTIFKFGMAAVCALATSSLAQDFCSTAAHSGKSIEISSNTVGSFDNGIGYELWNEGGNGGSVIFYDDGSFKCTMTGAKDYLCRSGLSFNSDKTHEELGHMLADFKLVKTGLTGIDYSYIGIYGWTREPLVEWYIVDNTGSQWMPGDWVAQGASAKNHGKFTIDGAEYTVYEGDRTSYSIDGDNTYFKQYFSVRTKARDCGTIDITAHFKKWEELGMKMGKMHEAKILGEAGSTSGANAKGEYDFPYAKVYIEGAAASSSSEAASSSSETLVPGSSSSTDAIHGVRLMTTGNRAMYVFDAQGKFLSSFETENMAALNNILKSRFNAGVYLVKQGGTIKSVTVK
ncbi:MAG: glycoside hydrolase family 11 protein [Fibrobacter sp.]|nr:glycoside hydrolase family 11 protein [Fibrobacter sp.]